MRQFAWTTAGGAALAALAAIMIGCGSSGSGASLAGATPVQAAPPPPAGYANDTVNGSYAATLQGLILQAGGFYPAAISLTLTADGNGNFTGAASEDLSASVTCTATVTGSYSVGSSGSGQAGLKLTMATGSNSNCVSGTDNFTFATNADGSTLLFTQSDTAGTMGGTAIKQ